MNTEKEFGSQPSDPSSALNALSGIKGVSLPNITPKDNNAGEEGKVTPPQEKSVHELFKPKAEGSEQGTEGGGTPPEAKPDEPANLASTEQGADSSKGEGGGDNGELSLLEKLGIKGEKKKEEVKIEDLNAVTEVVKQKFGVDKIDKFFESAEKWRNDSQLLSQTTEKVQKLESIFKEMPEDLYEAVVAWGNNQDYRAVINARPAFDYNQPVDKQDAKSLVNTYFPDKFDDAVWNNYESEDGDPSIKKLVDLAIEQAKDKYVLDQNKFKDLRAGMTRQAEERRQKFESSISSSVQSLKSSLPDVDDSIVKDVERSLSSGEYRQLIFDQEGNFSSDAAFFVMMAKYGRGIIEEAQRASSVQTKNEVLEEVLLRTPEKPNPAAVAPGGATQGDKSSLEKVQKFISSVIPKQKKTTF